MPPAVAIRRQPPARLPLAEPLLPAAPQPLVEAMLPKYPGWFRPLARVAERMPNSALRLGLTFVATVFAAGFGLGYLLR